MPNVMIRADASPAIGSGHVMRCLALAGGLREAGAEVFFICRRLSGNLIAFIEGKGFPVKALPPVDITSPAFSRADQQEVEKVLQRYLTNIDWIIVDHYQLDARWEKHMRSYGSNILAIDDLANRPHDCEVVLNQNGLFITGNRYEALTGPNCIRLMGPKYALLRPEFRRMREVMKLRRQIKPVRRILVCFGGADPTNETAKALRALERFAHLEIEVVVGAANPRRNALTKQCALMPNVRLHVQTERMAAIMAGSDTAVCGAGSMTWERYCTGLPAVLIAVADNQSCIANEAAAAGIDCYLGRSGEVTENMIAEALSAMIACPEALSEAGKNAMKVVDGRGVERVVSVMMRRLGSGDFTY